MKKISIYIDGSCLGNPGPGGWAAILELFNDDELILSKRIGSHIPEATTNNRMEIMALLQSLAALRSTTDIPVYIYTDSMYIVSSIEKLDNWHKNDWHKKDGKLAVNSDLWKEVLPLINRWKPTMIWVQAHADNAMNRMVDNLARGYARNKTD